MHSNDSMLSGERLECIWNIYIKKIIRFSNLRLTTTFWIVKTRTDTHWRPMHWRSIHLTNRKIFNFQTKKIQKICIERRFATKRNYIHISGLENKTKFGGSMKRRSIRVVFLMGRAILDFGHIRIFLHFKRNCICHFSQWRETF